MAALSPAQRARLERLRARADVVRDDLVELGGSAASGGSVEAAERAARLRAEYSDLVGEIAELEHLEGVAARAGILAREKAFRDLAKHQAQAGARIGQLYQEIRQALSGMYAKGATGQAFLTAIRRTTAGAALARNKEIRAAMMRMGEVASALNHDLAIRAFGRRATGAGAKALGIALGGGVDRKIVDGIWGSVPEKYGLAWLLAVRDQQAVTGLTGRVKELVSLGADYRRQFQKLRAEGLPDAKLSAWVRDLGQRARDATQGVPGGLEEYRNLQRQARAYLAGRKKGSLGTQGAGNQLVKRLDRAVKETDHAAVDRALEHWVERKTAYNSVLAMRTATNRTYDEQSRQMWLEQPYVYAERRVLAAIHPKTDVCNAICSLDLGLGPGIYPIGKAPAEHPNGLCRSEPVLDDEFLDQGGVPLAWRPPADIDRIVADLSHDGAFAKVANGATTPEELQRRMKAGGFGPRDPIELTRGGTPRREAPTAPPAAAPAPAAAKPPRAPRRKRPEAPEPPPPRDARPDPIGATPAARHTLRFHEDSIRARKTEKAVIIDPATGTVLLAKTGTKSYVNFHPGQLEGKKGAIFTHNHPNGTSLSLADIRVAAAFEFGEMRATTAERSWVMRRGSSAWNKEWVRTALQQSYVKHEFVVRQETLALMESGALSHRAANMRHFDEIWKRVAAELGLDYSEEPL